MSAHSEMCYPVDVGLASILDELSRLIGPDKVFRALPGRKTPFDTDRNVGQFPSRHVPALLRPSSTADVQTIVRLFGEGKTSMRLYALSTGRSWGLGSFLPPESSALAVDLRALNATRRVDIGAGWAEIEPGVTQLDLSQQLTGTDRVLNVTASSGHTSILGNALDRGVGLRHQRTNDLLGLEIVLPDGALCHVGWWPREGGAKAANPLGIGPSLLHLFTQSNLGIVTAAIVKLLPRPECQRIVRTSFPSKSMRIAIDVLRRWVAQELVAGVVKVYDSTATQSYGSAPNRHLVLMSISGTHQKCVALGEILASEAEAAGCFGPMDLFDSESVPADDTVLKVVERAYAGDPSFNEIMLKAATGQEAAAVDSKGNGWIFFLPFVPFSGEAVEQALRLLDEISLETGVRAGTTVNTLSADVIDLVVSMKFDPEERASVLRALDLAYERFELAGFHPYRLDIDHGGWRARLQNDEVADRLVRRIKELIDPANVIAPGRYA